MDFVGSNHHQSFHQDAKLNGTAHNTLVAFSVLLALALAAVALFMIRKTRARNFFRSSLPQPPDGIRLNPYTDDNMFADTYRENDVSFSSRDAYHDTLPSLA
jgi:hypothetical protein